MRVASEAEICKPLVSIAERSAARRVDLELEVVREIKGVEEDLRMNLQLPAHLENKVLARRGDPAEELSGLLCLVGCLHCLLDDGSEVEVAAYGDRVAWVAEVSRHVDGATEWLRPDSLTFD